MCFGHFCPSQTLFSADVENVYFKSLNLECAITTFNGANVARSLRAFFVAELAVKDRRFLCTFAPRVVQGIVEKAPSLVSM